MCSFVFVSWYSSWKITLVCSFLNLPVCFNLPYLITLNLDLKSSSVFLALLNVWFTIKIYINIELYILLVDASYASAEVHPRMFWWLKFNMIRYKCSCQRYNHIISSNCLHSELSVNVCKSLHKASDPCAVATHPVT